MTPSDQFARLRAVFARYATVAPSDNQLANLVYLTVLADKAPVGIIHGKAYRHVAAAVRTLLREAPGLKKEAENEADNAHREGRTTDMDHLALKLETLLAAIDPLRPITARRDRRGAWRGWAKLMAHEVRSIVAQCSRKPGSFAHETSPNVRILAALLNKQSSQIVEGLRNKRTGR